MFKFNENTERFEDEINGIRFVCEELFDRCELAYLEHTLDSVHIIQITFPPIGLFDELWEMNVNG